MATLPMRSGPIHGGAVSGESLTESASVGSRPEPAKPRRNEWLLVAFTGTTHTADAVMRVALPLLATTLTDSPALVAAVVVMLALPWLVTALHVGVYVDRMNRRSLMVGAEFTRMASIAVVAIAYAAGMVSLPL